MAWEEKKWMATAVVVDKGVRDTNTRKNAWRKWILDNNWLGKQEGSNFTEFLQLVGPQTCNYKSQRAWLRESPEVPGLLCERKQGKQPSDIPSENSDLKSAWGIQWEGHSLILRVYPRDLPEQRNMKPSFPSLVPHSISTEPPTGTTTVPIIPI